MFKELPFSGLESPHTHTRWTFLVSLAGELLVLGFLLLIPLIYVRGLPAGWRQIAILPPVPEIAPTPPVQVATATRAASSNAVSFPTFVAPRAVTSPGAPAGTVNLAATGPGIAIPGIPNGTPGGSWTSLVSPTGPAAPPATKGRSSSTPFPVGGDVEAAKLQRMIPPEYPSIAIEARIQGTVLLDAVIGADGKVESVKYISGPPMLVQAAEDAVRQWLYKPTLLNGRPVPVETIIKVIFTLGDSGGSQPPDPAHWQLRS